MLEKLAKIENHYLHLETQLSDPRRPWPTASCFSSSARNTPTWTT